MLGQVIISWVSSGEVRISWEVHTVETENVGTPCLGSTSGFEIVIKKHEYKVVVEPTLQLTIRKLNMVTF